MKNNLDKELIEKKQKEIEKSQDNIIGIDMKIDDATYDLIGGPNDVEISDEELEEAMNDPQYRLQLLNEEKKMEQEKILKLKTDIEIEQRNMEYKYKVKNYKKGILVSDNETKEDLLSREDYSKIIADYINSKKTDTPFNIGIFGEWGEGKSSFLKLIEEEIRKNNISGNEENYLTHVIRYDATEYTEQNKIWACILKQIFKEFEKERKYTGKLAFFRRRFVKRLKKDLWKHFVKGVTLLLVVIWWIMFNKRVSNLSQFKNIIFYSSVGVIPLAMAIVNIVIPFIKSQLKISKPLSDMVVTNMELPNYSKDLGVRENIKEDLSDLLTVWLKKKGDTDNYAERLVIFVDELDRCSEQCIIELFEAMQLFLSLKQIVIVFSINFNPVYYALRKKFEYIDRDTISDSNKTKLCIDYLEKYINIPFFLSYEGKYDQFINALLPDNKKEIEDEERTKNEAAFTSEQEQSKEDEKFAFEIEEKNTIIHVLDKLNNISHITPRTVKRVINILILSKQMCIKANENKNYEKIQFNNYIKWFLFAYFNPEKSFDLLKIIDKKKAYYTIRLVLGNLNEEERQALHREDGIYSEMLNEYLLEIRVNEINMFKDISNYFIFNEEKHIK